MRRIWAAAVVFGALLLTGCLAEGTYTVTPTLQNGSASVGLWHTFGGDGCYWERLRGFSGALDDIIANDLSAAGPRYVEIKAGDAGFRTSSCLPWVQADGPLDRKFGLTSSNQQFGDGDFRVGSEMPAGRYQASTPADCYWARLSGFGGELADVVANANGQAIVDIAPSDVGFTSSRCGIWTKIG